MVPRLQRPPPRLGCISGGKANFVAVRRCSPQNVNHRCLVPLPLPGQARTYALATPYHASHDHEYVSG
jgi:hypothetical protein